MWKWRRKKPRAARRYRVPLTTHQLWMVSLGAPVHRGPDASRTTLYPFTRIDDDSARRWLADQWEITTRDELVGRLDDLARTGYRARAHRLLGVAPLAWDAALYVDISRRGFACGLLTEADAWTALKNIVPAVAGTYASWHEYAGHYLLGRQVWRDGLRQTSDDPLPAPQATADAHLRSLLDPANRSSPWNLAPWDSIRQPERAR
ncbi:DUF1266 domain-containing protein [Streptomyces sp. NPDC001595]|uniref:DUF1266 domain-containing protein n=1 Tax=Streptomyces sp. NPDC001532 TaxID=3154520 RepID=UPI003318553C